jgi:hypothetical protein
MDNELESLSEYENDVPVDSEQHSDNIEQLIDAPLLDAGNALQELKSSKGWTILKNFIEGQIESHKLKLVVEDKFSEVRRVQEYIKALQNILLFPDTLIEEASKYAEQLVQQKQDLE